MVVHDAVSVGYEYESCASLILWEKRTATLQGFELEPTNLGGWSLDKHHVLNTRSGMWTHTHIHTLTRVHPIGVNYALTHTHTHTRVVLPAQTLGQARMNKRDNRF